MPSAGLGLLLSTGLGCLRLPSIALDYPRLLDYGRLHRRPLSTYQTDGLVGNQSTGRECSRLPSTRVDYMTAPDRPLVIPATAPPRPLPRDRDRDRDRSPATATATATATVPAGAERAEALPRDRTFAPTSLRSFVPPSLGATVGATASATLRTRESP